MPEVNLIDFFTYYKGTTEQKEAVQLLQSAMPGSLLTNKCAWVVKYREQPPKPEGIVTPELMERLTGYAADKFPQSFCDDCNALFEKTGFAEHLDAMQMLMANLMHETGNFRWLKELADGWAYEGRKDLGNVYPGDGPKYKGGGVLQLTGRYNYERAAKLLDDPKILEEGVDYVAEHCPFTSALAWIEDNRLLDVCLKDGFDACCKRINGGWNGIEDRRAKYEICKAEMR